MKNPRKYFIFNKKQDYERGYGENIEIFSTGIRIKDLSKGSGYYITRLLDSRERMMAWHRFLLGKVSTEESSIELFFYSSEEKSMSYQGREVDIESFLKDPFISVDEKIQNTESFLVKRCFAKEDILLKEVTGRYLWILIQLNGREGISPEIHSMQAIFPKETWLEYLPEIYQNGQENTSFLERYLGIFQTIYENMTEQITEVPRHMEVSIAERKFLLWIAEWLAVDDKYLWNEEQLRYLLKHAMSLYRKRGTVSYLQEIVKLYTGRRPYIVEFHQLQPYRSNEKQEVILNQLYGDNPYLLTIIVDTLGGNINEQYRVLCHMIENAVPANVKSNVVVLRPYIFLNQYSYLGINSVLEKYQPLKLDGFATIPFATLENQGERMKS